MCCIAKKMGVSMNKNAHYSFLAQLQYMTKFCGSHVFSHLQNYYNPDHS